MMPTVEKCTTAEILDPANMHLIAMYAEESSIAGMPHPQAQLSMYQKLETAGALCCFGAYKDSALIGFITVLTPILPHYGTPAAIVESFFVDSYHRKTGAGTLLLRKAEDYAKSKNAAGILISAPTGGSLSMFLGHRKSGYRHTNDIFFRGLYAQTS